MHDVDVRFFVPAADVVDLAQLARFKYPANGAAVVFNVQPVADLLAIAVHRQGLACQRVDDHQGDQLFRKMIRPVVIAAVGGEHRQTIGVVVGPHQVVTRSLAGGVRAVRLIAVGFGESRIAQGERAIHLIGRDMQ